MIKALELTRRETLLLSAAALASSIARSVEAAQDSERHGMSAFGDLKYPPDFQHVDYVNPNAPKGGTAQTALWRAGGPGVFSGAASALMFFASHTSPSG
jgi:microcin C transport system substrate-binding protein